MTGADAQDTALAPLAGRDRLLLVGCIVALAGLAWGYLVHVDRQMAAAAEHAAMEMAMDMPTTGLLFLFAMWAVMMVAMMAGPAIPMVLLFAAAQTGRGERRAATATSLFGFGYAIAWIALSAAAALAQWMLHEAAMLSPMMAARSPRVGGFVLVAIGLYKLTPLKSACLTRCRSPLGFLMTHWHDGPAGAVRMGLRYGIWCVGCCWALMAILFVVGIMNLAWVGALMLLVLVEKVAPGAIVVSRVVGIALVAGGVLRVAGVF